MDVYTTVTTSDVVVSRCEKMFPPTAAVDLRRRVEHIFMKLYVGSLPYRTTDQDLADLFGQVGQVVSATVIIDRETGRSKGFGFVEMSDDQEAQTAINRLNNSQLEGRTIIVNEANERREPRRDNRRGFQSREPRSNDRYRDRHY